jgi:hypothetical protein
VRSDIESVLPDIIQTPPHTRPTAAAMPGPIQVEARSLAALNNLASNPPQYPRNPAHGRQEPLTLYISRVPGTKGASSRTYVPVRHVRHH